MLALVKYFLNNKIAVNVFMIGAFLLGLLTLKNIPREGMPSGVDIEVAGEASKTKLIMSDIKIAALAAVVAIFLVLALFLNSWKNAAIIMAVVPFSVIGIILALFIHSQPISMFVLLALIGLSGVVGYKLVTWVTK